MAENYAYDGVPTLAQRADAAQASMAQDLATVNSQTFDQRVTARLAALELALYKLAERVQHNEVWLHRILNPADNADIRPDSNQPNSARPAGWCLVATPDGLDTTSSDPTVTLRPTSLDLYTPAMLIDTDGKTRRVSVARTNLMSAPVAVEKLRSGQVAWVAESDAEAVIAQVNR